MDENQLSWVLYSPYKIYAGNLGWTVTSELLKDAFSNQPGVLGTRVVYEHYTGQSRGYGFVTFASPEDAQSAIQAMNGKARFLTLSKHFHVVHPE